MVEHSLKILPEYFEPVLTGDKPFEVRKNDRNFRAGDLVIFRDYENGRYTGRSCKGLITYVTDYAQQIGYVVLGFERIIRR